MSRATILTAATLTLGVAVLVWSGYGWPVVVTATAVAAPRRRLTMGGVGG